MQRCGASGAAARGSKARRQNPTERKGEKNSEKILAPQKVEVLEIVDTQTPCLEAIELVETGRT